MVFQAIIKEYYSNREKHQVSHMLNLQVVNKQLSSYRSYRFALKLSHYPFNYLTSITTT